MHDGAFWEDRALLGSNPSATTGDRTVLAVEPSGSTASLLRPSSSGKHCPWWTRVQMFISRGQQLDQFV